MTFVKMGLLGIFLIAAISGTIGFISGAMMASSKIDQLHSRLDHAEFALRQQSEVMHDLGKALTTLLRELDGKLSPATHEAVSVARAALARI